MTDFKDRILDFALRRVLREEQEVDLAERIGYNALPGTMTGSQWAHPYLQQANEINAGWDISPHVWKTDGSQSTGYGVAPK